VKKHLNNPEQVLLRKERIEKVDLSPTKSIPTYERVGVGQSGKACNPGTQRERNRQMLSIARKIIRRM